MLNITSCHFIAFTEVNEYGAEHVNRYTDVSVGTACNSKGYGGMAYYTSETCGYVNESSVYDGCTTDYTKSEVKYVVDAWKNAQAPAATEARLIKMDELKNDFGYELGVVNVSNEGWFPSESTPDWLYNSNYTYWTMSPYDDSESNIWGVYSDSRISMTSVGVNYYVVRPVIVLPKSAL